MSNSRDATRTRHSLRKRRSRGNGHAFDSRHSLGASSTRYHGHRSRSKRNSGSYSTTSSPSRSPSHSASASKRNIGLGLNINLTAAPLKSLSKNSRKSQSKPATNTFDLSQRKSNAFTNTVHSKRSSLGSRFIKRISAPIVVPTSKTPSLSSSIAGARATNIENQMNSPHTPNTPYYTNIASSNSQQSQKQRKKKSKSKSKSRHKHKHSKKLRVIRTIDTILDDRNSTDTIKTNSNSQDTVKYNTNLNPKTRSQYLGDSDVHSSTKSLAHSIHSVTTSCSSVQDSENSEHESEQFMDDQEVNEMIRSCKRMSKSNPRAYSKSRRISQKLFGLMETISLENNKKSQCHSPKSEQNVTKKRLSRRTSQKITVNNNSNSNSGNPTNNLLEFECSDGNQKFMDRFESEAAFEAAKAKHDYKATLCKYGYSEIKVIAKSLQGIVIEARSTDSKLQSATKSVIIKITDKKLHFDKISKKHGKALSVQEDIIKEKKLLMYLTANNPPPSLMKFHGFFDDEYNYYLVMENGGTDFFDWIVQCHKWIREGKLSLKQWNLYIRDLMFQIITFLKWMHNTMHVTHLDISLENMLIANNKYKSDGNGGIRLSRKMQIKFCDFGLAEFFDPNLNPNYVSRKYVGKTHYKAPKVYGKRHSFDARKADIWSLGVSFFMMLIGAPPYKLPVSNDDHFPFIQENNVMAILKRWGRDHYINKDTESLLNAMMNVDESQRFTVQQIEQHPYLAHYTQKHVQQQQQQQKVQHVQKRSTKSMIGVRRRSSNNHSNGSNNNNNQRKSKRKPSNPIRCSIMETYHDSEMLAESSSSKKRSSSKKKSSKVHVNANIFENLVMTDDDGKLFGYRKRKLTST